MPVHRQHKLFEQSQKNADRRPANRSIQSDGVVQLHNESLKTIDGTAMNVGKKIT